ncbi:S8 family serine peptidase [Myxococcus stipitatus]|uniref:S8 family peptidase n=1 Tax=Myxococcus stipitatus TaxID=83455 RepID=UPI003144E4CA
MTIRSHREPAAGLSANVVVRPQQERNSVRTAKPQAAPLSQILEMELATRGVADVLVVLGSALRQAPVPRNMKVMDLGAGLKKLTASAPQPGRSAAMELAGHFTSSAASNRGALLMALAANVERSRLANPRPRGASSNLAAGLQRSAGAKLPPPVRYFPRLGVMLGTVDARGCAALQSDERVASVTVAPLLQLIRPIKVATANLGHQYTWGIEAMRIPELWAKGFTGKNVKVGHLDTGVDGKHPALRKAIAGFAYFDDFGNLQMPPPKAFDTEDHGTHTAATIAGRPVKKQHVGIAPGAMLESACVIEGGYATARVLGGMDWAIGQGVRVLNMSLGFPGYQPDFLTLTQILREKNVLPVFAIGNEGPGTSRSPGNYSEALSVGATDEDRQVADFSSSESLPRTEDPNVPDLVAPGVDVISAQPGGGYQSMSGSSMATPHISGLAALLIEACTQAKREVSVDELERAILDSCQLGTIAPERGGSGFPDAVLALSKLGL